MAAEFTTQLVALLDKCQVPNEVRDFMKLKGMVTVSALANACDDRSQVQTVLLQPTALKDDIGALTKVKMAWREADTHVTRALKRSAEGLENEELDDPLPFEILKNIMEHFVVYYRLKYINPALIGSDGLLSRVRREFERKQATIMLLQKVRSIAMSQLPQPQKKARLGDLVISSRDDYNEVSLRSWLRNLEILRTRGRRLALSKCRTSPR